MNKPVAPTGPAATEDAQTLAARIRRERSARPRRRATVSGIPIQPLYTPPTSTGAGSTPTLGFPGQPRTRAASTRRCTAAAPGRSASWSASARRPTTTRACATPRPGRDRGLADPVQLGLPRLRHGRGRRRAARHLRRRGQQRRPHGRAASTASTSARLVRDERSVAVHAARLHARRRRARAASTGTRSPARPTRATTSRISSPTTCSSASRCRGAARPDRSHRLVPRHAPRWNPMSVVGQHMQQAGATPAEAMAFTLSSAIQNAEDCIARGMYAGRVPAALHVLLRHLDLVLRGDRQVPRRPAHLGPARARAPRRGTRARGASSSTPRPRAST